jgi:hypothetical protein
MLPDDARDWRLRRDDTCAICGIAQPAGTQATWSPSTRRVYCTACAGGAVLAIAAAGTAGGGARRIHDRRSERDTADLRRRWGRLAPLAELVSGPKQSTQAWAQGAEGEARLAAYLERELAGMAILLHDRRIPGSRANIDHVAVGPSGVWVIDAKRYTGRVERRDVGGLLRQDVRVFVGGRDRTKLAHAMPRQVSAVGSALADVPAFADVPVRAALCFTDSDWGVLNLGKPFVVGEVLVAYPGALADAIRQPELVDGAAVGRVAARLATALSAA